jgi:hypothetical protein
MLFILTRISGRRSQIQRPRLNAKTLQSCWQNVGWSILVPLPNSVREVNPFNYDTYELHASRVDYFLVSRCIIEQVQLSDFMHIPRFFDQPRYKKVKVSADTFTSDHKPIILELVDPKAWKVAFAGAQET